MEAGRVLFAGDWVFTRACHSIKHLPASGPVEVAFAGRSNVGKSSLLNALVGQKQLARSSNTPGRTRALNLFARSDGVGPVVVDMPGYGYAKAPKAEVAAWTALVFDYLRGRPNLARVYLLIDARHGPKPVDIEAMGVMDEAAISYQAVLTKCDKAGSASAASIKATEDALRRRPAAHPEVLLTSSAKGDGIAELRAAIATLAAERG
ncbi:YihA family ribosome biogenesis GTP-binding protein [Acuticoccus sediminis]|uniref:Probable GTP-binding protein EngB n=1 Tax=Acuticoccus sediminis TaxID=2184697 RepID=A0A8B2NVC3_9HYPH|nr:ribosome biogenesis GTP-binding protein YihA/YsxC [Acuticoccus sediminis]RAH99586.1 YihA family ribosome biogenesis GTP-binding protein [Acuticoccus sediminis]